LFPFPGSDAPGDHDGIIIAYFPLKSQAFALLSRKRPPRRLLPAGWALKKEERKMKKTILPQFYFYHILKL
jgi:hypothetical protein